MLVRLWWHTLKPNIQENWQVSLPVFLSNDTDCFWPLLQERRQSKHALTKLRSGKWPYALCLQQGCDRCQKGSDSVSQKSKSEGPLHREKMLTYHCFSDYILFSSDWVCRGWRSFFVLCESFVEATCTPRQKLCLAHAGTSVPTRLQEPWSDVPHLFPCLRPNDQLVNGLQPKQRRISGVRHGGTCL